MDKGGKGVPRPYAEKIGYNRITTRTRNSSGDEIANVNFLTTRQDHHIGPPPNKA